MNWGKYLAIVMGLFMLFIISMSVYMLTRAKDDFDSLYYEKGIAYHKDYNRKKQVITDKAQPIIKVNNEGMLLSFTCPSKGKIMVLRPSDRKLDRVYAMEAEGDGHLVFIPANDLHAGPWQIRIEWESNRKQYLLEREVIIP